MSSIKSPPIYVLTSDKYLWLLRGFSHLFNIYWGTDHEVTVIGFDSPSTFVLPDNFGFLSVGEGDFPPEKWSDALLTALAYREEELFVLMLEDYWLTRRVDVSGVRYMYDYMAEHSDILRGDLTGDRLYAGGKFEIGTFGHLDLVETPHNTPYQISLQAGIWRRELMMKVLKPGTSPWEFEMHTQPQPTGQRVIGSHQMPVRYCNVMKSGRVQDKEIDKIPDPHRGTVRQWIG
jgi:hypothetical protein